VLSDRASRGLEVALFLGLVSPLLWLWVETTGASSRLSYALLVPALALVLALRARREEASAPSEPDGIGPGLGTCAALAASAALLLGTLTGLFTISLLALPLAAIAYMARWTGIRGVARRTPALLFLFAMVPPPMPVMDRVNPFLVQASGQTAVVLLTPFDPQSSWFGSTLEFRGWTLIVAEVCSGSGTFLTLGVLCAFLAGLFRLRPLPAVALVLLSFPLTLLVNGLRIASSALVIDRFGVEAGHGLPHELLGQAVVITSAAMLALGVERLSSREFAHRGAAA